MLAAIDSVPIATLQSAASLGALFGLVVGFLLGRWTAG